jgi:hypothetical protein
VLYLIKAYVVHFVKKNLYIFKIVGLRNKSVGRIGKKIILKIKTEILRKFFFKKKFFCMEKKRILKNIP